jgi:hypothetical protein
MADELSPEANAFARILYRRILRDLEEARWKLQEPLPPPHTGRPRELAYVTTRRAWLTRLETAIRELEGGKPPRPAIRKRVAKHLSIDVKTLRRYLTTLHIDFDEVRERIRNEDL